jgi:hypothetical protein
MNGRFRFVATILLASRFFRKSDDNSYIQNTHIYPAVHLSELYNIGAVNPADRHWSGSNAASTGP